MNYHIKNEKIIKYSFALIIRNNVKYVYTSYLIRYMISRVDSRILKEYFDLFIC